MIEAAEFYEARSAGLGDRFLRAFDAAIAEVQAAPQRWTVVEGDLRSHTMGRFPFSIYYHVGDDELRIFGSQTSQPASRLLAGSPRPMTNDSPAGASPTHRTSSSLRFAILVP